MNSWKGMRLTVNCIVIWRNMCIISPHCSSNPNLLVASDVVCINNHLFCLSNSSFHFCRAFKFAALCLLSRSAYHCHLETMFIASIGSPTAHFGVDLRVAALPTLLPCNQMSSCACTAGENRYFEARFYHDHNCKVIHRCNSNH